MANEVEMLPIWQELPLELTYMCILRAIPTDLKVQCVQATAQNQTTVIRVVPAVPAPWRELNRLRVLNSTTRQAVDIHIRKTGTLVVNGWASEMHHLPGPPPCGIPEVILRNFMHIQLVDLYGLDFQDATQYYGYFLKATVNIHRVAGNNASWFAPPYPTWECNSSSRTALEPRAVKAVFSHVGSFLVNQMNASAHTMRTTNHTEVTWLVALACASFPHFDPAAGYWYHFGHERLQYSHVSRFNCRATQFGRGSALGWSDRWEEVDRQAIEDQCNALDEQERQADALLQAIGDD